MGPYSANLSLAWSYAAALLTFAFAYSFSGLFARNRVFGFRSDISCQLYVIHRVAGYVALRVMRQMGFKAWASLLVVTAGCLFLSLSIHMFIERPTQALGKRLASRFDGVANMKLHASRPAFSS